MGTAINCAFARVGVLKACQHVNGGDSYNDLPKRRFESFNSLVENNDEKYFSINFRDFNVNSKKIATKFKEWNRKGTIGREERLEYIDAASCEKWIKMSVTERRRHTLRDCKPCENSGIQNLFMKNCEPKHHRAALKDIKISLNVNTMSSTPSCKAVAREAYEKLR